MNGFYLAKRQLKWAGICDILFSGMWALLIFIFTIYHFGYLLPNQYRIGNDSNSGVSAGSVAGIVASKGYSHLFNVVLIDFVFFKFTLWTLVLIIWIFTIMCFIGKVLLGVASLIKFFKGKSIQHIYAALSVIFFPAIGGIIAINTYKATTSRLSPKYLAPHSFVRFRLKRIWNLVVNWNSLEDERNGDNKEIVG